MQYSISFDETFAALMVKALRKLPLEEVEGPLSALIKHFREQEAAAGTPVEAKQEISAEEQVV